MRCCVLFAGGLIVTLALPAGAAEPSTEQVEFFEKRVRPVLVEHCHKCHGPKDTKGGLRLDSRAAMMRGGDTGPAIIPGEPSDSLLIDAVRYDPDGYQMPPTGKLPDDAIAALTEWVRQGAVWPGGDESVAGGPQEFDLAARAQHWSFQPVQAVTPPDVQRADWCRNPVDRFVLSKLEAAGLSPATEAEKRVLIRRVTFELTGLPPTSDDVAAFLADESPDAYERLIDRLLASPRYGERWARHWLDLVRYAETAGHEFDYEIPYAWRYRDYVIRALNDDLPYDLFVIEHLAGDLLPDPRRDPQTGVNESVLATAFYWFGQGKHSPVDIRAEECDTVDNQLDVIGKTFQGLTIACARCHDHKFDAIRQADYYALAGFLQSSRRTITDAGPPEAMEQYVDRLTGHVQQQWPTLQAAAAERAQRFVDDLPRRLTSNEPDAVAWRKTQFEPARADRRHPLHMAAHWLGTGNLPQQMAGWREIRERESASEATEVALALPAPASGGWFPDGPAFANRQPWLIGAAPQQPLRGIVPDTVWAHSGTVSGRLRGTLRSPTFTITQPYIDYLACRRGGGEPNRKHKNGQISLIIDGFQLIQNPLYGSLTINLPQSDQPKWHRQDVSRFLGSRAYIEIEDLDDGEVIVERIDFRDGPLPQPAYNAYLTARLDAAAIQSEPDLIRTYQAALQAVLDDVRFDGGRGIDSTAKADVLNWLFTESRTVATPPSDEVRLFLDQHRQLAANPPEPQYTIAITDGTAEDERLLIRGNPKKPGDPVRRRFLEALQPVTMSQPLGSDDGGIGSGRLEWARCVADPRNPLTARVLVNRLWLHHFGRGLVPTPDDFGLMGQPPSHPELLDWLATEFVSRGWSIKQMHRLLLTSATYRQSSRPDDVATEERDPQNILLHRMNVQRLEAEPIRDALLALSGRLDDRLYGPSVMPHLTPFMEGRGRPGQSGPLDGDGRRSLYINVRRNFLTPMFLAFDFPTPFTTMGKRSTSNVPAQALTLMNNPFVVQQARQWADGIARATDDPSMRIHRLYQTAFHRDPTADELAAGLAFLDQPDPAVALRDLAHVLLNVKEFVFVE
jgi:cytochrome c553